MELLNFGVSENSPYIVDSVPEGVKFLLCDGQLLLFNIGEVGLLVLDEVLKSLNFFGGIFNECHEERLGVEEVNYVLMVAVKMVEITGDNGSHVIELKSFFLVLLETDFPEDVAVEVVDNGPSG